jgi:hypothetical protein
MDPLFIFIVMSSTLSNPEEWRKVDTAENFSVSNKGRVRNDRTGRILNPYHGRHGILVNKEELAKHHTFALQLVLEAMENAAKQGMDSVRISKTEMENRGLWDFPWKEFDPPTDVLKRAVRDVGQEAEIPASGMYLFWGVNRLRNYEMNDERLEKNVAKYKERNQQQSGCVIC